MKTQYLEVVTPDVDAVCAAYSAALRVELSPPVPALGGARTARLHDGSHLGVRAPLRESELPVVRPYWLVPDIQAALVAAEKAGARVAVPAMRIPGYGTCAIYLIGGNEHGLWQV